MGKSIIAIAILSTLCACSSEPTRYVGTAIKTTPHTQSITSNDKTVMFEYKNGKKEVVSTQNILTYAPPKKATVDFSDNYKSHSSDLEKKEPTTITGMENVKASRTGNSPVMVVSGSNTLTTKDREVIADISRHLTPEDEILNSTPNPLDYQVETEKPFLSVQAVSKRLFATVDTDKVKAHLIANHYNTDVDESNDRKLVDKPKATLTFVVKKGTLKENISALLSHGDDISVIANISNNHFMFNEFEMQGSSMLHILDRILDAYKSPHPLKARVKTINKIVDIEYDK